MKKKKSRKASMLIVFIVLCLITTTMSYILGNLMYRTNTRNTYQNLVYVELTDFIENVRYGLHFGKSLKSFYGMNDLLTGMVEVSKDIEGLYVVDSNNSVLFATDETRLSQEVLELSEGNVASGDDIFMGMTLTKDGSARLIARCKGSDLAKDQKIYALDFLLQSIVGMVVTLGIILLLWKLMGNKKYISSVLTAVLFIWIFIDSASVGISAYSEYSNSIEKIDESIIKTVERDEKTIAGYGVSKSAISSYDTYFKRYIDDINEVGSLYYTDDDLIVITSQVYVRKVLIDYVLQTLLFLTFSALILAEYHIFANYTGGEETDGSDAA